jgi:tryptophanase
LIGVKNDSGLFEEIKGRTIPLEGFISYGGLSGRDLEAMAIGLQEGVDYNYLRYRIGQMEYMAGKLDIAEIPYQSPVGGHAVFVNAGEFLSHIPYYEFPGQALAVELYIEAGIRGCDIGSYMMGNDPDTGKQIKSQFEFTRLAVPRRVYTQSHLDVIIEALIAIKNRVNTIPGYKITWEPKILRHFTSRLTPVD